MPEPAPLKITTRSGNVQVRAVPDSPLVVTGGTTEELDNGTIHIRRSPSESVIEVQCAPNTDVTVGTLSGRVELDGALGAVRIATVSGRIRVEQAARIDVRTRSGKVEIGECAGPCRVMTTSSNVHVRRAGDATVAAVSGAVLLEHVDAAEVKSISGKVLMGVGGGDRVSVRTVSGKVDVRVPSSVRPSTRLRSISGRIRDACPPGDDCHITISSVSGSISVSCPDV
jgi:DUF4097 and DUF4098 domain-containing protein YvlB